MICFIAALHDAAAATVALTEQFFELKQDPLDFAAADRFTTRYYISERFYKEGAPLLLYLSDGSAPSEKFANLPPTIARIAESLDAAVVVFKPRTDEEFITKQITKMSIQEDVKTFIRYIRMMKNYRSVIAIGANQMGDLAIGSRQAFPSYFDAAVKVVSETCFDLLERSLSREEIENQEYAQLLGLRYAYGSVEQCAQLRSQIEHGMKELALNEALMKANPFKNLVCALFAEQNQAAQMHFCGELYEGPMYSLAEQQVHGREGSVQMGNFVFDVPLRKQRDVAGQLGDAYGVFGAVQADPIIAELFRWLEVKGLLEK